MLSCWMSIRSSRRFVLDTNSIHSTEMVAFLQGHPRHKVVLTEMVMMEMMQHEPLRSFSTLQSFPKQVLVTKSLNAINHISRAPRGLSARLIDHSRTQSFRSFFRMLNHDPANPKVELVIQQNQQRIAARMAEAEASAANLPVLFDRISRDFTRDELRAIATKKPHTRDIHFKFADRVVSPSRAVTQEVVATESWPKNISEAVNHLPFRFAVCTMLLCFRWVEGGKQVNMRADKMKNDLIDANVAATATYFDAVLSTDQGLKDVQAQARQIIRAFGGHVP